ncbi:5-azacytidine resistance protein azr1 [Cordyceps fumosorosea ARSEF 2679]|uniref:Protein phosphatase n=1 Tax=Cordyceps fumosorosea (strain ARSEF 2679) TaxID=1081104 RepID=A0A168CGG2_CORFA|nr:5-azacytidine resistance protein azr1 [Cordyceps fumosorosea ARSEF 2679]OAA71345.1 5-azacytidine resistance protein azr1 [Cordyceps fumosorosea ARSEF 2679]
MRGLLTRRTAQVARARFLRPLSPLSQRSRSPTVTTTTTTATTTTAVPATIAAPSMHHRSYSSSTSPSSSTPSSTTASPISAKKPRFSYHIAASFIAKDRPFDPSTHVFHFNPYNRIQPPARHRRRSSRPESGHDAFFASRAQHDSSNNNGAGGCGAVAFGVADGVGGWVDSGVDPADFSHGLCDYMASAAWEHPPTPETTTTTTTLTARKLMQLGYDAVCADTSVRAGGSTACVAVASADGLLDVANLGDSGFLQLRLNAVHAHSEPQTHAFNTPFQLSVVPPAVAARMAAFGGTQLCDLPRDADVSHHRLRHGDVLVLATDGVLDNLFNQDVLRVAGRVMRAAGAWTRADGDDAGQVRVADDLEAVVRGPLQRTTTMPPGSGKGGPERAVTLQSLLATELVLAAKRASVNTKQDGPFAKEVQKYYPQENWHGGKIDDICVVAVVVVEDPVSTRSKL